MKTLSNILVLSCYFCLFSIMSIVFAKNNSQSWMASSLVLCENPDGDEKLRKKSKKRRVAQKKLPKNNAKYEVRLLPFNSKADDFSPTFYQNGLVFCSTRNNFVLGGGKNMDLYFVSINSKGDFGKPQKLRGKVNSRTDEGPAVFSANGKQIFFTKFNEKAKKATQRTLGIYTAKLTKGQWQGVARFEHNFKEYNVGHPSLSPDNQRLYFVSDIPQGYGGSDIYVCHRTGNGWSRPQNLGSDVNTWGNEKFPYVHADGTLYFSSNGHTSKGGLDVFYTFQETEGVWASPRNMGEPINSTEDDFGLIVSADNKSGFFSSNRGGGAGFDDIYAFKVNEKYLKEAPLTQSNSNNMTIQPANYIPFQQSDIINENIGLERFVFGSRSYQLNSQVEIQLDKLATFLLEHSNLAIELGVHTSSKGHEQANERLSVNRANMLRRYLVAKGVPIKNVSTKGYGETQIRNQCKEGISCTDELHAVNERVEVKVLEITPYTLASNPQPDLDVFQTLNQQNVHPYHELQVNSIVKDGYLIQVGPFSKISNRAFYECRKLTQQVDYQHTPEGQLIVLGPYDNIKDANRHKNYIIQAGIGKTKLVLTENTSTNENDIKTEENVLNEDDIDKYKIYIGPYKHVDNDTYHKLARMKTSIGIEYTTQGMMIVLGPYYSEKEAEKFKEAAKVRAKKAKMILITSTKNSLNDIVKGNVHKRRKFRLF